MLRAELHAPGRLHWQARGTAPGLKSFCRVQYSVRCLRPVTAGFADFQAIGLFMQGSLMLDIGGTWLTAEDRQILRHPEVGGLIIFARNIEHPAQVRELCAAIRAIRPDLLLAVDQEGGRVQRLRQGFVRLPAMRAIADNPNAEEPGRALWLADGDRGAGGRPRPEFRAGAGSRPPAQRRGR